MDYKIIWFLIVCYEIIFSLIVILWYCDVGLLKKCIDGIDFNIIIYLVNL